MRLICKWHTQIIVYIQRIDNCKVFFNKYIIRGIIDISHGVKLNNLTSKPYKCYKNLTIVKLNVL